MPAGNTDHRSAEGSCRGLGLSVLTCLKTYDNTHALIEADPDGKAAYEKNLAAFLKDLDALDAHLVEALAPVKGKTFMVFHPDWATSPMPMDWSRSPSKSRERTRAADKLPG